MEVIDLKCEYASNPVGLDVQAPQLSWRLECDQRGLTQAAYQVSVAASAEALSAQQNLLWDSGKVISRKCTGIAYAGPALESRRRYFWQVKVWVGESPRVIESEPAFFEMGLLEPSDWQALWIGCPASWTGRVLYFRKAFSLQAGVERARVYVSGLGYYVLYINGQRVGDHVLDPGLSDYSKRILYATYDIGACLHQQSVIGVVVGPGWYGVPKLRLQAEITYQDDHTQIVATCW
ncbi:MAG TPA: alpha-L-rhamnosidase N-terminal domain-containing protein, partial [Verrucomicrobiae bacterium]|nr:alpha-L-rhamnosidase N-terminal domain-containing protein [Verrucomicrobiae bacterium]